MKLGKPIAKGNSATMYKVNGKMVKVFNQNLDATYVEYEAAKQRIVYQTSLFVPEVIELTKVEGKQAIIMEYIEGKTLGELFQENGEQVRRYLEQSIDVQKTIHQITSTKSLEKMSEKLTRQIHEASLLSKDQKRECLMLLNSIFDGDTLCHGDLHLFNLIQTSTKEIAIIDWIDASMGDARADVCRSYLLYTQHSVELAELYLEIYCDRSGKTKEDILQWLPVIAAARLSEHVQTEDSKRLVQYVESAFS
ncbi:aminoglycoside phosphotransferase family protein [Alkalicoccobacillus gibsonii]|uniref:Aminoglycoside phosphotransferase family protein n=1 Tax=Alkalicoccobacillus gibsonii TaxID=79881 RepID=A0ABU9VH68_9BACI